MRKFYLLLLLGLIGSGFSLSAMAADEAEIDNNQTTEVVDDEPDCE